MTSPTAACSVAGCGRAHKARGYCRSHYRRWQRHGDPRPAIALTLREVSYRTAHAQVRADRGPATDQRCADCAAAAVVWSYDGNDPDERTEPTRGRRYSLDPARYRPRCRFCHRRAVVDCAAVLPAATRRGVPELDVERAARLYQAGATARGIGALLHVSQDAVLRALRAHGVPIRPNRSARTSRHPTTTT